MAKAHQVTILASGSQFVGTAGSMLMAICICNLVKYVAYVSMNNFFKWNGHRPCLALMMSQLIVLPLPLMHMQKSELIV
jgi:hypothetical protein